MEAYLRPSRYHKYLLVDVQLRHRYQYPVLRSRGIPGEPVLLSPAQDLGQNRTRVRVPQFQDHRAGWRIHQRRTRSDRLSPATKGHLVSSAVDEEKDRRFSRVRCWYSVSYAPGAVMKAVNTALRRSHMVRACAAAISRLVYTVFYFKSDDTAYTLSALSLWLIAEMTCMFLIFAGPAVPQAFARTEGMVKMLKKFRLWSKWSSRQPTDGTDYSSPKSFSKGDAANSRKAYRKIDELELQTTTSMSEGAHPRDFTLGPPVKTSATSIMRTTQFTTVEEYIPKGAQAYQAGQQHPWKEGI